MKNFTKFLTIAILGMAFSVGTFAQSATATATAQIVSPLIITKTTDMNFGIIASGGTAGTVELTTLNARNPLGGVTLAPSVGVTAAVFSISGEGGKAYTLAIPSAPTTIDDNASHSMTVDTWTSVPAAGTNNIPGGGSGTITIGATLNVGVNQVSGTYVSDIPFTVTVNYN